MRKKKKSELLNDIKQLKSEIKLLKEAVFKVLNIVEPKKTTLKLGEWLIEWRDTYKTALSKGGITPINAIINYHLPKWILETSLDNLNPIFIQKVLNDIKNSRTRKNAYSYLKSALLQAYSIGITNNLVMDEVLPVAHKYKKGEALNISEQRKFLNKISGRSLEKVFKMYLLTGCRRSELLSLKWQDIDYERKLIFVKGTKTELSDRYIPLFPEIKQILLSFEGANELDNIFVYNKSYLSHAFKKYCSNHRLHDLRHTFATRCLESGINIKVVQLWLGHADIETTLNTYSHVVKRLEENEASKFKLEPAIFNPSIVEEQYNRLRID